MVFKPWFSSHGFAIRNTIALKLGEFSVNEWPRTWPGSNPSMTVQERKVLRDLSIRPTNW